MLADELAAAAAATSVRTGQGQVGRGASGTGGAGVVAGAVVYETQVIEISTVYESSAVKLIDGCQFGPNISNQTQYDVTDASRVVTVLGVQDLDQRRPGQMSTWSRKGSAGTHMAGHGGARRGMAHRTRARSTRYDPV